MNVFGWFSKHPKVVLAWNFGSLILFFAVPDDFKMPVVTAAFVGMLIHLHILSRKKA